jgi:O-antigen/teichoic acid export membrane protein
MNTAVTYEIAKKLTSANLRELRIIFSAALITSLVGTLFFSVFILLISCAVAFNVIPDYFNWKLNFRFIPLVILILIFSQIDSILSASLKGLHQFKFSSFAELFIRFFNLTLIALVAFFSKDVYLVLAALMICSVTSVIVRYLFLRHFIKFIFLDIKTLKKSAVLLFKVGKWMTLQGIAGNIYASLDKLIVGFFLGTSVLGAYSILSMFGQLIHFIPASMLQFIMPKVAAQNRCMSTSNFRKLCLASLLISFSITFLLITFKSFIFTHFLLNIEYTSIFYLIICSYFLLSLSAPSFYIAIAMNMSKVISFISTISVILGISVMLYFIEGYGIFSVVSARLIYSIVALTYFFLVFRALRKSEH